MRTVSVASVLKVSHALACMGGRNGWTMEEERDGTLIWRVVLSLLSISKSFFVQHEAGFETLFLRRKQHDYRKDRHELAQQPRL